MPVSLLPLTAPDTRMAELDALLSAPAPVRLSKPPAEYMPLRVRQVLAAWAEYAGTTVNGLRQGSQLPRFVDARRQAIRKLREMGYSTTEIGGWLRVNHTTVIYHLGVLSRQAKASHAG